MEKVQRTNFKLYGLKLENKTTNENNQSSTDCGNLWQRFENENIPNLITNKVSNEIYAVYYNYEKEEIESFSYFIGCKVHGFSEIPNNMDVLEIPSQNYIKVTAKGVMTDCITDAWITIRNLDIKRKFGFDFEIYDEKSKDWKDAELDIHVSIGD